MNVHACGLRIHPAVSYTTCMYTHCDSLYQIVVTENAKLATETDNVVHCKVRIPLGSLS